MGMEFRHSEQYGISECAQTNRTSKVTKKVALFSCKIN